MFRVFWGTTVIRWNYMHFKSKLQQNNVRAKFLMLITACKRDCFAQRLMVNSKNIPLRLYFLLYRLKYAQHPTKIFSDLNKRIYRCLYARINTIFCTKYFCSLIQLVESSFYHQCVSTLKAINTINIFGDL